MNKPSTSKCKIQKRQSGGFQSVMEKTAQDCRSDSIIRKLKFSKKRKMTEQELILYKLVRKCRGRLVQKKFQLKSVQERLKAAQRVIAEEGFQNLLRHVNETTLCFIRCQINNQKLKPNARRFSLDEKVLSLALYKSSPKAYRLLNKLFSLPSIRTLLRMLQKLKFFPGVNNHIFQQLEKTVRRMKSPQDKVCALIFDEISLATNLKYDRVSDMIMGLEDNGSERKGKLVDHANIFFLKGLHKQFKQPLSFTFSKGPIKSLPLKSMITELIEKCQSIGLNVMVTICDQGANNQAAIKILMEEKKAFCQRNNIEDTYFGFLIKSKEVVPLFDTPHLFKGLRNNMLTKDLHFTLNGQKKIAKWDHIVNFYNLNMSNPNVKINNKLSDAHVIPGKINKMKVKLCTQVFSHAVGSMMKLIAQWQIQHDLRLPLDAVDTADLILFLDELFDSLNVTRATESTAKPLKRAVNSKTQHHIFWEHAIEVLNSMQFYCPQKKKIHRCTFYKKFIEKFKSIPLLEKKIFE
ncbi:uncharacterized protein LOC123316450 isoform X2 [Coccinella septempunctata]|nr:uncharacterized protein LOC123316450 isoform X2 [Coccinella septempunctata]